MSEFLPNKDGFSQARIPTITVPNAKGRPHSFVSRACDSASPVLIERVLQVDPVCAGSKPARAAFPNTSCHAAIFAANPSGFDERCGAKSEYSEGRRALRPLSGTVKKYDGGN